MSEINRGRVFSPPPSLILLVNFIPSKNQALIHTNEQYTSYSFKSQLSPPQLLFTRSSHTALTVPLSFFRWCSCVDCTKVALRGAVEERRSDSSAISRALPGPQEKESVPWCWGETRSVISSLINSVFCLALLCFPLMCCRSEFTDIKSLRCETETTAGLHN